MDQIKLVWLCVAVWGCCLTKKQQQVQGQLTYDPVYNTGGCHSIWVTELLKEMEILKKEVEIRKRVNEELELKLEQSEDKIKELEIKVKEQDPTFNKAPCVPKSQDPNGYTLWAGEERRSTGVATVSGNIICDRYIDTGWYRVESKAGEMMPTAPVEAANVCGTTFPVWMDGNHPTDIGVPESRRACVSNYLFDTNPCLYEINIEVCNCSDFMVYKLPPVPGCDMGYCFGDGTPCDDGTYSLTGYSPCTEI